MISEIGMYINFDVMLLQNPWKLPVAITIIIYLETVLAILIVHGFAGT